MATRKTTKKAKPDTFSYVCYVPDDDGKGSHIASDFEVQVHLIKHSLRAQGIAWTPEIKTLTEEKLRQVMAQNAP